LVEEQGADPNIVNLAGNTPLMVIIKIWGNKTIDRPYYDKIIRTFQLLVERADVLVADRSGDMAIHVAVLAKNSIFLRILLDDTKIQHNIDIRNVSMGYSAVQMACGVSGTPIENIKLLLSAGADPNMRSSIFRRTPLQLLMEVGVLDVTGIDWVIAVLRVFFESPTLELGDPTIRDLGGDTLLHTAAREMRSRYVIEMLLDRGEGANVGSLNTLGETPLTIAIKVNNDLAVAALENYGRKRSFGRGLFGIA
jgi:ankyrin repeat protein